MTAAFADKAASAWAGAAPDWVTALAVTCDASGLRATARRLDVSPTLVSLTINRRQRATGLLEDRVRSRLMAELRVCPVLGPITEDACAREQARPLATTNPHRVRLYRACRDGCPYFTPKQEKNHAA